MGADGARPVEKRDDDVAVERVVRCARCGHELAKRSAAIEVCGRHAHVFMNPSGVIFDVRCFADVAGAVVAGEPDADTSWFPGTAWSYAHCAQCGGHVGWRYVRVAGEATPSMFFGLIADSIVDA